MNEIAIRTDGLPGTRTAAMDYQSAAVARLAEWAQSADAAYNIADKLVQSSFVPASFKGKAVEATAAILAGLEVGLQPMAALRSFDVIQNQAAPRAITLRAIVQSFGHQIELVESTATRCRMRGKRRDSETWQSVTWTLDRAKDLGLTGKDNWKKQPAAMLVARATSELARLIAADAILGIGYSSEEIVDGVETVNENLAGPVPAEPSEALKTRRMSRKRTTDPDPEPSTDAITDAQQKKMHAGFRDHGMDRNAALRFCSSIVGGTVESTKDLTKQQASEVIEALTNIAAADAAERADNPELIPDVGA